MDVSDFFDQCGLVLRLSNAIELRFHRGDAFGVDRFLVHTGSVEVADLLVDGIAAGATGFGFFEDAAIDVFVALIEFDKADPLSLVGRNLGILDPVAAGVLVEIDAGVGGLVDVVEAEAGRRLGGGGLGEGRDTR